VLSCTRVVQVTRRLHLVEEVDESGGGGGGVGASSTTSSASTQYSEELVISPVTAFTEGLIAAMICMLVVLLCAYAYRVGNSHRRAERNLLRRWIRQVRVLFGRLCSSCKPAETEETKVAARRRLTPPEGMVFVEEEYLTFFGRILCYAWLGCPGVGPLVYQCCRSTRVKLVTIEDAERDRHACTAGVAKNRAGVILKRSRIKPDAGTNSHQPGSGSDSQRNGKLESWQHNWVGHVEVPASLEMVRDANDNDDRAANGAMETPAFHSPLEEQQGESARFSTPQESATNMDPAMNSAPCRGTRAHTHSSQQTLHSMERTATPDGVSAAKKPDDDTQPSCGSAAHVIKGGRVKFCLGTKPAGLVQVRVGPARPHMVNPDMNMNMQRATGAGNVTVESHSEEDLGVDDTVQVFGDADNSTLLQTVPSPPASPAPEHESTADASLGETRAQSVNVADASAYAARAASVQAQRQEESLLKRRAQAASLNRMAMLGECANSEEMRDFVQMRDLEQAREQAQERAKRGREMSKPLADERQSLQHRLLWKPKQTSTSVAAVTIELQLRKVRKELRWRGPRERACRVGAAWAFNLTVLVLAYLVSIIFCARFGERETSTMSVSWLIAYGLTFLLIEPVQVLLLAGAPFLFDETTLVGRCCLRVRLVYNELCAP